MSTIDEFDVILFDMNSTFVFAWIRTPPPDERLDCVFNYVVPSISSLLTAAAARSNDGPIQATSEAPCCNDDLYRKRNGLSSENARSIAGYERRAPR